MVVTTDDLVDATPQVVWAELANPEEWPKWTDSIDSVELLDPILALGSRARVGQPGMRPMVWTVSEFEAGRSFTWVASTAGITTVGTHTVDEVDGGRSRLRLGLTQRGALAPVVGLLLGGRVRRYVQLEAAGLKAAAESRV